MMLNDEANALREHLDDLALGPATDEDWQLADARLFHVMVEVQQAAQSLEDDMITLVKTSKPSWCWFEKHAALRELQELFDDLWVLRMCVRTRSSGTDTTTAGSP